MPDPGSGYKSQPAELTYYPFCFPCPLWRQGTSTSHIGTYRQIFRPYLKNIRPRQPSKDPDPDQGGMSGTGESIAAITGGELNDLYKMALGYGKGDWEQTLEPAKKPGVDSEPIAQFHVDALRWYSRLPL